MAARSRWKSWSVLAGIALVLGLAATNCARREDQLFKTSVVPILKSCVDLKGKLAASAGVPSAEQALANLTRQREVLERFHQVCNSLPQPRAPRLRFLAIKIGALAEQGLQYGRSETGYGLAYVELHDPEHKMPIPEALQAFEYAGDKMTAASADYDLALIRLGATEHVVLGTLAVRDGLEAKFAGGHKANGSTTQSRDSTMTALEEDVRKELAEFR